MIMTATGFFHILDSVDSTNNYAMAKVRAGMAQHGMAWFAHEQTAGKGQRGKNWQTEPGKNITMSLVVRPLHLKAAQHFLMIAVVARCCFDFFSAYAGEETTIKWPNDLYWGDRKAGGILIENIYQGEEWKWGVIGIGININQINFGVPLKNAVSLQQITGKEFDTVVLAKELRTVLLQKINDWPPADVIIENYNRHLYKKNKKIQLRKGNMLFETIVKGVSAQGQLLTDNGIEQQFDFGEVEWMIEK